MSSSPHDAIFRGLLGLPEHARGALRVAVPPAVAEALDWESLTLCPGSFIDAALGWRHTDLLFSARWRTGEDALAYFLFEHQSTSDDRMAFRLLRYLVRIWERWLDEHPHAERLPVILPVVLYHGTKRWPSPLAFEALFQVPDAARAALEPHMVRFSHLLDDLSEIPERELRTRAMTALARLVQVCLKHARDRPDLLQILRGWADIVREVVAAPHGLDALVVVMRYILMVNDHVEPAELQSFLEQVAGPEARDTIMTAGERLIQQGEERGLQKGRQEGRQEGERGLLLRLLRRRFGAQVDRGVEQRLADAAPELIATWAERVLTASTLAETLAD